jgi:IS1 family transposase
MLEHSVSTILPFFLLVCYLMVLRVLWPIWRACSQHRPSDISTPSPCDQRFLSPTEVPPCPGCEEETRGKDGQRPSGEPPPRLEQKRGRPRSVDTDSHYCPNLRCRYYGWLGLGNIRANGHPNGGCWRQLECVVCGQTFMETINTIFYGKQVRAETIWQVLKALAEGLDIRATGRVFDLDANTVSTWLGQAGAHMRAVSHYLIHDLHLSQVQVDELWALLGQRDSKPAKRRATRWVWAGIDPVSKLMLAYVVGDRSLASAQWLIHAIALLLAPGCLPLFISDHWSAYGTALLTHFGHWVQIPRRHIRGRTPKPRWQPLPGLLYAQVVKQRLKGRVVKVSHRVVYGTLDAVMAALKQSGVGQGINTAFIERLNLSIRQHVPALARKVTSVAKTDTGLNQQLALGQAYYNFCLPHASLKQALPQAQPTKGNGSPKKWRQRTPAMAAGKTERIWRLEELLLFRVPPWSQDGVVIS